MSNGLLSIRKRPLKKIEKIVSSLNSIQTPTVNYVVDANRSKPLKSFERHLNAFRFSFALDSALVTEILNVRKPVIK